MHFILKQNKLWIVLRHGIRPDFLEIHLLLVFNILLYWLDIYKVMDESLSDNLGDILIHKNLDAYFRPKVGLLFSGCHFFHPSKNSIKVYGGGVWRVIYLRTKLSWTTVLQKWLAARNWLLLIAKLKDGFCQGHADHLSKKNPTIMTLQAWKKAGPRPTPSGDWKKNWGVIKFQDQFTN